MDRYKSMPRARARQAIPGATKATSVAGVRWSSRVIAALLALVMTAAVVVIAPGVATASTIAPTATWTEQNPATSPPARSFASMAFDPATGTMVLFGGDGSSGLLADTWTWNGTTWTKQSPTTSPSARYGASMAYDPATGSMVLFGGYGNGGALSDTWTWQELATTPGAPTGLSATPGNGQVALSWSAPSSDGGSAVTGYDVYEGTTAGGESTTPVNSTPITTTTYTPTGLTNGTTYYFTVEAINAVGNSSASSEVSATPATTPGAPTGLSATPGNGALRVEAWGGARPVTRP